MVLPSESVIENSVGSHWTGSCETLWMEKPRRNSGAPDVVTATSLKLKSTSWRTGSAARLAAGDAAAGGAVDSFFAQPKTANSMTTANMAAMYRFICVTSQFSAFVSPHGKTPEPNEATRDA